MSGHDLHIAEIARHAPSLSTLVNLLFLHAVDEPYEAVATCCTSETGYQL